MQHEEGQCALANVLLCLSCALANAGCQNMCRPPHTHSHSISTQVCSKQYQTAMELEEHLSSYDHHHKKVGLGSWAGE